MVCQTIHNVSVWSFPGWSLEMSCENNVRYDRKVYYLLATPHKTYVLCGVAVGQRTIYLPGSSRKKDNKFCNTCEAIWCWLEGFLWASTLDTSMATEQKWWHMKDQSSYAPSQWEMLLCCNNFSHWLGEYLDWYPLMKVVTYLLRETRQKIV